MGEFGSVGAAYLFPEANYTKLDDLLKEEWCKVRPDMASLSAWTLTAYARRFDNLKKQLIADNKQSHLASAAAAVKSEPVEEAEVAKRPWQRTIFYRDSCIPKFDLEALGKLTTVEEDIKALVRSRQWAKERQEISWDAVSKMSLASLWEEEWKRGRPKDAMPGPHLQRKLYEFESQEENVALLKPALLRLTEIKKEVDRNDDDIEVMGPERSGDDFPHIIPRQVNWKSGIFLAFVTVQQIPYFTNSSRWSQLPTCFFKRYFPFNLKSVYPDNILMTKEPHKKSASEPPDEEFSAVCEVSIKHPKSGHKVKKLINLQRDYFPGRSRLGLPAVEKVCLSIQLSSLSLSHDHASNKRSSRGEFFNGVHF